MDSVSPGPSRRPATKNDHGQDDSLDRYAIQSWAYTLRLCLLKLCASRRAQMAAAICPIAWWILHH